LPGPCVTRTLMMANPNPRKIGTTDPVVIRQARELALLVLGDHVLGGNRSQVDSWHRDCVHEAGHCIAALSFTSARFERVTIRPHAVVQGVSYPGDDVRIYGNLGGPLAERDILGNVIDEGASPDLTRALDIAVRGSVSREAALVRLRLAVVRVSDLLAVRRRGLLALARVLFRVNELSFDEVQRVVQNAEEARP
jgi:hypothetical protein